MFRAALAVRCRRSVLPANWPTSWAVRRGVPEDASTFAPAQRKAVWAITHCRTAALGGHRQWCPTCGFERFTYHSCRNRHCPKCQSTATAAWVAARQEELLPVPYFHNVFTLPHELNRLILYSERNQRVLLETVV